MAFNGSGTFIRNNGSATGSTVWAQDRDGGTKITSTHHDTHDQDIAAGLSNCITKDGQSTPTADLPMGGYKHTNCDDAAARTQYATAGQVLDGSLLYYTTGGTASAQTVTASPAYTAYTAGMVLTLKIGALLTNPGAVTLNVNGLGPKALKFSNGFPLIGGELYPDEIIRVAYNGTYFALISYTPAYYGYSPTITPDAGTFTSVTTDTSFMSLPAGIQLRVKATGTTSTGVSTWTVSPPSGLTILASMPSYANIYEGSTNQSKSGTCFFDSTNFIAQRYDVGSITAGAGRGFALTGFFARSA